MNKYLQLSIDCVLLIAVIVLFILHFCCPVAPKHVAPEDVTVQEGNLPIAYVDLDSVLVSYTFAIQANDQLQSKQEDALAQYNAKRSTLEREAADFQRKVDNNAFLSRERAQTEAARLQQKQADLEALNQSLTQQLMNESQRLQTQLGDSLRNYIDLLNADGRFHIILADHSHSTVLKAGEGYDITGQVIEGLNARCAK